MPETAIEYQVWYDAFDGARRSLNALTQADAQEHIAYLRGQDDSRQLLAASVGLNVDPHEYNFEVVKVSTQTSPVKL